jgi:hypothetical protein
MKLDEGSARRYRRIYQQQPGRKDPSTDFKLLAVEYSDRVKQSLMDTAAALGAVGLMSESGAFDSSTWSPQMVEAFKLQYPSMTIADLLGYEPDQLAGFVNGLKGKLLEVNVRDKLNSGEAIGRLQLSDGQEAMLASSPNQPDWDLQILNADGTIDEALQIKASSHLNYVRDAITENPEIAVISTDQLSSLLQGEDGVIASGYSIEEASVLGAGDSIGYVAPVLPFIIISAGEYRRVRIGTQDAFSAIKNVADRSLKTGAALGVGAAFIALDGGLLSIPATMLTRLSFSRKEVLARTRSFLNKKRVRVSSLLPYYQAKRRFSRKGLSQVIPS